MRRGHSGRCSAYLPRLRLGRPRAGEGTEIGSQACFNAPPGIMIMIRSSSGWLRLLGLTINGTMKRDASRFDSVSATPILRRAARQSSLRESATLNMTAQHHSQPRAWQEEKPERSSVTNLVMSARAAGGCRVQPAREGAGSLRYCSLR